MNKKLFLGLFFSGMTIISGCVSAQLPDERAEKVAEAYMGCALVDFFKRNSGKSVDFDSEVQASLNNCSSQRKKLYDYGYNNSFAGQKNVDAKYRKATAEKLIRESDKVIKKTIKNVVEMR